MIRLGGLKFIKGKETENGTYLFDFKYIPLLLIEGHKCNGENKFSAPYSLIKKELRNILPNKIDCNENYIKQILEPYININENLVK